jgi:L,D-transpeptidase ErfK/SrfK
VKRVVVWCLFFLFALTWSMGIAGATPGSTRIVINVAARILSLYDGDALVKQYPIAIGKPSTPSPVGDYQVVDKEVNPWWYPTTPGMQPVPSGPDNPLGYRWIGFTNVYGVHGTNAPWSIGTSSSKGCIRMHEEDVEELFPKVSIGTPVSIIYDTIRVAADKQGGIYATVYEDVYEYGTSTKSRFKQKLAEVGAADLVSEAVIRKLLNEESGKSRRIAQLVRIKINDKPILEKGILTNDIVYIPVEAVAKTVGIDVDANRATGVVTWQGKSVTGELRQGRIYVGLYTLHDLFGAHCMYEDATATASIELIQVYFNGKSLPVRIQKIDGVIAIPMQTLMQAMSLRFDWQLGEKNVAIAGRKIPVVWHEAYPYIPINRLQDALDIYVFYDIDARLIQLTYIPFISSGP